MRLLSRRVKLAFVAVAAAAATLGGLTFLATAASAETNASITAYGGPQEVYVTGSGYDSGYSVRVTVLTSDLRYDLGQQTVHVTNGTISADFYNLGYTGPVAVAADELTSSYQGTQWADATTTPELQFTGVSEQGCGSPYGGEYVTASASNFLEYYGAHFELLNQNLTSVLSTYNTSADTNGQAKTAPWQLETYDYHGGAWLVVDETGYGLTAGLPAPYGNIPAPATAWYHINLC
jgi:hypothetical protein